MSRWASPLLVSAAAAASVASASRPPPRATSRHHAANCVAPVAGGATALPTCLEDADVTLLPDGSFFNRRLDAPNVFEIDVDESVIDEAADIFYAGSDFHSVGNMAEPYEDVPTPAGRFFAQRVSWASNIAWVSADDAASFSRFEELFERLRLPERFASVVPHASALRLYSAFYVVRSWCDAHNFHTDYLRPVGTDALTLITPLRDFRETDSFQLTYKPAAHEQPAGGAVHSTAEADGRRGGAPPPLRRYAYQRGKAIVFGSGFEHSTEPGAGHEGEVHAYLCFTFGTDRQERWPAIAETLDTQSRVVQHPDGELKLSALGSAIEAALKDLRAGGSDACDSRT